MITEIDSLKEKIELFFSSSAEEFKQEKRDIFTKFLQKLESGEIRAAEKHGSVWKVNPWVKKGILLGFRLGEIVDYSINDRFRYFDKDTFPLRQIDGVKQRVRIVPGGSAIRSGAFVGERVTIMPPSYINVGAYVDDDTMVDSHALVGSCAQIGKRVHLSAGAQIGGVLEPIGAMPVIIEDEVMIGGNTGIYEGTIVERRAVIGAGVVITGSTPVYDLVRGEIYRKTPDLPIVIPEGAVVVGGARKANGKLAEQYGIFLYSPVIVKYRDEKTDTATVLEMALR